MTEARPIVTDAEIEAYMAEGKPMPNDWIKRLQMKPSKHGGHKESEFEIVGDAGSVFRVRLRQSDFDQLSFSAILFVLDVGGVKRFRRRRYNGRSHGHRNRIEGSRLPIGFHIHAATERYQLAGFDEDAFATSTDRYSNLNTAVECLMADCGCRDERPDAGLF